MAGEKIPEEKLECVSGGYELSGNFEVYWDGILDVNTGVKYYCSKVRNIEQFKSYLSTPWSNGCQDFESRVSLVKVPNCELCLNLETT